MNKKVLRVAALLFSLFAGYYLYRAADLYFHQSRYVYHPEKAWIATPGTYGIAYKDVTLRPSDGVQLSAWFVPAERSKGTVIFCHGNARNMSSDLDAVRMFHGFHYNILIFDYRGYGKSTGHPDEEGTYRDAEAAWSWVVNTEHESPGRIVISGRSLGSAIAGDLASKHAPPYGGAGAPGALILEAAFTSLAEAGQDLYPYFPVKFLSRYKYATLSKCDRIHCPVLIVHSRQDELIPFRHAERLYAALKGKKEFIVLGGPHKGGYKPTLGKYERGVKRFLDELNFE